MSGTNLLKSVHGLRGCAALLVVFHHSREQIDSFAGELPTTIGTAGVDIFFVISGLVMIVATSGRAMTRAGFLAHRIRRVVPLYWFITLLTAAVVIIAPSLMKNTSFSLPSLGQSLAFWPHYNADKGNLSPLVKLGWTLNFEMLFYSLFALFLPVRDTLRLACVGIVIFTLITINIVFSPVSAPLRFWGQSIALEFVLGMAIGIVVTRGSLGKMTIPVALLCIGIGVIALAALADAPVDRILSRGLPSAAIVLGLVAAEWNSKPLLTGQVMAILGNASYAIYLGHLFAVRAAGVAWHKAHLPEVGFGPAVAFVCISIVGGIIAGLLLHFAVERPLASKFSRRASTFGRGSPSGDYVS